MYGNKGAGKGPPLPGLPNSTICNLPWSGVAVFKDGGAHNNVNFCEQLSENLAQFEAGGTMFENIDISGVAWNVVEIQLFFEILVEKAVPTKRLKAYRCSLDDFAVSMICQWLQTLPPTALPQEFHLSHNRISDAGFVELLNAIESMRNQLDKQGPPVWLRVEGNQVDANIMNQLVAEGRAFFCPKVQDRLHNTTAAIAMPSFQPAVGLHRNYGSGQAELRTPVVHAGPTVVPPPAGSARVVPAQSGPAVVPPPAGSARVVPAHSGPTVVLPPAGARKVVPTRSCPTVVLPLAGSGKVVPPRYPNMNGDTAGDDYGKEEDSNSHDIPWDAWDELKKDEGWTETKSWNSHDSNQNWGSNRGGGGGGSKENQKKKWWEKDTNTGDDWGQQKTEEQNWWEKDTGNRWGEKQKSKAWKEYASNDRSRSPPPGPRAKQEPVLPHPWEKHESAEYGIPFYWNTETGESVWEWPPPGVNF